MGNLPHNNMMIITKDYHLYHLKLTNEFQAHELSRSQSLKVEWPKLVNDPNFSKVKKNVLHSVFIADSVGEYFLMITKEQCQCLGLIYDIGRKEVKQGFQFTDSESAVMISTDKVFDLFMVMNDYMGQMMIMRYQFNNPTITRSNQIKPEKLGSFYRVCKWDFERIQLIQNTVSSCVPIKWKIQNGFFSNGYFYLFDNEQQVYIFSEKIYSQVIVQYQQTSFERFINCNISGRNIVEKKTIIATFMKRRKHGSSRKKGHRSHKSKASHVSIQRSESKPQSIIRHHSTHSNSHQSVTLYLKQHPSLNKLKAQSMNSSMYTAPVQPDNNGTLLQANTNAASMSKISIGKSKPGVMIASRHRATSLNNNIGGHNQTMETDQSRPSKHHSNSHKSMNAVEPNKSRTSFAQNTTSKCKSRPGVQMPSRHRDRSRLPQHSSSNPSRFKQAKNY
ncbi:hypothetical protein RDWZM_002054 [Blomia tropicalis]|uniref:Uncharacterized protein n=1 Tax=Blomia tropicalis TaxID=40697 RepID=A0A9Q0RR59_BLOTA|nr:hypothetical protein RDWZM_002054 [Blomia tropicalis]